MSKTGIFDAAIHVLDKVLELRTEKLQAISSNIANAQTPGYKRIRMEFEDKLLRAVNSYESDQATTHPAHMPHSGVIGIENFQADFTRERGGGLIGDGNTVRLDQEMVDLSVNQIRFEAAITSLNKKFSMLKYVIQEKI